jgi:hypothetical protein
MKKILLYLFPVLFLAMITSIQQSPAQDEKTSTVHITITEDGKVSTDTSFELKEGQDPEMIKKMVEHLAGGQAHGKHISHDVHLRHCDDSKMIWIGSDGDCLHGKHMVTGINIDSIKEAHPDAKILVIKKKDGEITVKELDDEDELQLEEHFHVKGDENSEHKVIIHSDEEDCKGKEKKIKVIVEGGEDLEWTSEGKDENTEVYIIKEGDKDVKVIKKKITVEIEDEEGEKEEETVNKKKKK